MAAFEHIFSAALSNDAVPSSFLDLVVLMAFALFLGLFICFIYQKSCTGMTRSSSFGITLVAMTMITTLLISAVVSNVALSLGMLGALSIVRFRAAVKDPMDIAFLFWAIGIGIVLAAGLFVLAVLGSLFIGATLLAISRYYSPALPYLLLVRCENQAAQQAVLHQLNRSVYRFRLKSKTVVADEIETHYEVWLKHDDSSFVDTLLSIEGLRSAILACCDDDGFR